MFSFTKQEKIVLIVLALIIFTGSTLNYVFKKYPQLNDIVNLIDSHKIYRKVNINKASKEELIEIPYIGDYTARQIIHYRQRKGPFTSIEQLKSVKGIREKNFKRFSPYIKL